jgi:2-polyprenyl-3-methyl-5-hydroxy-6-metoxy-1,4-benzoquinol methylase
MIQRMTEGHTAVSWHSVIAQNFDAAYRTNPNFRERLSVWSKWIDTYARPDFSAADLGCGSGVFTLCLSRVCKHVTALDGSGEMISLAKAKLAENNAHNVSFVENDIKGFSQSSAEKFDIVTCSSVVEYLDDLEGTLQAIAAIVKPGGLLLISSPNKRSFFRRVEPYLHRYIGRPRYYKFVKNVLYREDMRSRLEHLGFDIVDFSFYARTRMLSPLFRKIGLREYSDNMYAYVCRKKV